MSHHSPYTISLKGLPQGVSEMTIRLDEAFLTARPAFGLTGGDVAAGIRIDRVGDLFQMTFDLRGTVTTRCDRCLAPLVLPVRTRQEIVVKPGAQYEEVSDEEIIVPYAALSLDCSDLLYEYVVLSLPISRLHEDGACLPDMQRLLEAHRPDRDHGDGRWERLARLKAQLQTADGEKDNK